MTLNDLKALQGCKVEKLNGDSLLKQRMMVMGIVPGVEIKMQKVAPLGDPIEIKLGGCNLSMRRQEAKTVQVELV